MRLDQNQNMTLTYKIKYKADITKFFLGGKKT